MKVWDCTQFFHEFELLKIRLEEMWDIVDYFIIIESTKTFQGTPKPCYLTEHLDRFKKYQSKLIVHQVEPLQTVNHALDRVYAQQNAMPGVLLSHGVAPEDLVLLGDLDEISRISTIQEAIKATEDGTWVTFQQSMYYYSFNVLRGKWLGTSASRWRDMPNPMHTLRFHTHGSKGYEMKAVVLRNGGWHFTFLGDAETVSRKIQSWGHQEKNTPRFTDIGRVRERIAKRIDPFDRYGKAPMTVVPIDETFPKEVRTYPSRYQHLIAK